MEQKKIREHKVIDSHPIIGSILFTLVMYIPVNLIIAAINVPLSMVIPGYPQSGPIGIIAAFLLGAFIYRRWFRPDAESLIKGGNMRPMRRFILMFVVYWVVSEAAGMYLDGTKLGLPSFVSVCSAITAGFIEELLFRGLFIAPMLRKNLDKKRIMTALLISAAVFGLVHGSNILAGAPVDSSIMQVGSSFALGIVFGAVFLCTGNLLMPALLHTLHDIIAFSNIGATTEQGVIAQGVTLGSWIDLAACTVLAICVILYLKKESVMGDVLRLWKGKWQRRGSVREAEVTETAL